MALVGGATRMPSVQAFISRLTGLPLKVSILQCCSLMHTRRL